MGQCEWADYPTKVLEKHWPNVPRWRDIRTLTGDDFYARTGLRTVTVLSGGFPCQPFSVAGKRRGTDDDRYLWPEMLRVISEIRPAWVVGENVPGIVNMALDTVLADLEGQGYACQAFNIPACAIDAPHKRARICIIGCRADNVENAGCSGCSESGVLPQQPGRTEPKRNGETLADSLRFGSQTGIADTPRGKEGQPAKPFNGGTATADTESTDVERWVPFKGEEKRLTTGSWWPVEPDVGRVANGIPSRVDRLKCLGNAVVPQQFYPFFKFIAELEAVN